MTGKDLARVGSYGQSSLTEKQQYALALSQAGELVPRNFWTKPTPAPGGGMIPPKPNPGAILYMLETAAMVGVNPMVGLTNIHIIEGKPSLSANLQAALVREAGHRLRVWVSEDGKTATCEIVRSDDPDFAFKVSWGDREMNAAGLANKDNWKKYQRSMKKARAITECIREACPEVLMGATYSPDELGVVTDEMGEPVELSQIPDEPKVAPQAGSGVSRETPLPETPIVDQPEASQVGTEEEVNWGDEIRDIADADAARALYKKAQRLGVLGSTIKVGRKNRPLGEVIVEVGQAFAASEAAEEATAEDEPTEDTPAVLDPNVVDAEVVE